MDHRSMSTSCHEKKDVSVLASPHLHTGTSFSRCVVGRC